MTGGASGFLSALTARKLIAQASERDELSASLERGGVTFYIGLDPTASSLHCGHLVPLYLLIALARRGNKPIVVIGDGTARIGDPSGKNEMRALIDRDGIARNADAIQSQLERILARAEVKAQFVRNGEWLNELNYIDFLRDIGSQFSVNRMLSFESFKRRLGTRHGLSFLEFNYMLLQAYDFLALYRRCGCLLQIGGDDQWGNIVAGIDLIRRKERRQAYALTTPLILTASGDKMGKTAAGALFVDPDRTSVFDYYQYWRNVDDRDVADLLLRFAEMPRGEIEEAMGMATINNAKARLAFEMTRFAHGEQAARTAERTARALFAGAASGTTVGAASGTTVGAASGTTPTSSGDGRGASELPSASDLPGAPLPAATLAAGISALDLFASTPLCASKSEARRLIQQGGARINGTAITDIAAVIDNGWLDNRRLLLKAGKKRSWMLTVEKD